MVYASDTVEYDAAFETLRECNCDEFFRYFVDNWNNCKMLWYLAFRKDLLTLGNHTNNRIENFNRQLKRMLLPNLHLSEALLRLVNGNYAFCSDIGYRHKREIGVRIDARCETGPSMFNAVLTNAALALVTSQYMKYDDVKSEMAVTEVSEGLFEIVHREKTFTVSDTYCCCSCAFYCNYCLPCVHIFKCREVSSQPYCDAQLLSSIPQRWKKEALGIVLSSVPTNCITSAGRRQIVDKVQYEQDRYVKVHKITTALCNLVTSSGGRDFEQKLHQLCLLLTLWQENKDVKIISSQIDDQKNVNALSQDLPLHSEVAEIGTASNRDTAGKVVKRRGAVCEISCSSNISEVESGASDKEAIGTSMADRIHVSEEAVLNCLNGDAVDVLDDEGRSGMFCDNNNNFYDTVSGEFTAELPELDTVNVDTDCRSKISDSASLSEQQVVGQMSCRNLRMWLILELM